MTGEHDIQPIGSWGKQQLYPAKVGTGPSTTVMVRGRRTFRVGQHIKFCTPNDVRGMCKGTTPPWRNGYIYEIDGDRLFIELM